MIFYSLTTAKKGSTEQESDDKFACEKFEPSGEVKKDFARFAVSDGATESSFSNRWADILVKDYITNGYKSAGGVKKFINKLSKKWSLEIVNINRPWYAQEKVKKGAFATLLGFQIKGIDFTKEQKWSAIAIGDSCLFQIRDNKVITSFPIKKSSEFTNTPQLLSSNMKNNSALSSLVIPLHGSWKKGDLFFICTDAFAAWFLSEKENNRFPWVEFYDNINYPDSNEKFKSWVMAKRESGVMKNDDTTVIFIKL